MNDTEQRIAIAKACGCTMATDLDGFWVFSQPGHLEKFAAKHHTELEAWRLCAKNYTTDLNAMHEACESVPDFEWCKFWERLETVTETRVFCKDITDDCKGMLGATAAQRAEAFLRTLDLWKP